MEAAVLEPFTARDGETLALYDWGSGSSTLLPGYTGGTDVPPPRAIVLMVHGLGEHAMRYEALAGKLIDWGFCVRAYDQRGHGESGGRRGALPDDSALVDDLAEVVDEIRQRYKPASQSGAVSRQTRIPLILLGHSMGGLVASRFVALKLRAVEGLVLSSPALHVNISPVQNALLALGLRFAPDLGVGNGLDVQYLSHDPEVVRRYQADRNVHHRISPRLAQFIATAGPETVLAAASWDTPTLLMYAGTDRLVDPAGSRAFAAAAQNSSTVKPGTVTSRCFDNLYHEIFNELNSAPVFATLKSWLDARF